MWTLNKLGRMGADSELQPQDAEVEPAEDDEVPALDPEAEARRVAAMSFIRKLGDPVLKSSATRSIASTTRCAARSAVWPAS